MTAYKGDFGVGEQVLQQVSTYRPFKHLLPRLEFLRLNIRPEVCFPAVRYMASLLGNSLHHLRIRCRYDRSGPHDTQHIELLLRCIAQCCPNLCLIEACSDTSWPGVTVRNPMESSLGSFLRPFKHLRSLSVGWGDVTPNLISEIGQLSRLRTLCFGAIAGDSSGRTNDNSAISPTHLRKANFFESLSEINSLKTIFATTNECNTILNNAPINVTHIDLYGTSGLTRLNEWLEPLERFINLTCLELECEHLTFQPEVNDTTLYSPILSLQNLHTVSLRRIPKHSQTALLSQIPAAWPQLESLEVLPYSDTEPYTALEGLIPIAQHCKKLTELAVALICRPFDVNKLDFTHGASRLQRLEPWRSPLEQPWGVLRCISILFPRLTWADGYKALDNDGIDLEPLWKDLNKAFRQAFG